MQERRYYSVKKIKIKKYRKIRWILLIIAIVMALYYVFQGFNHYMEPQLLAVAKQHTGFAINNIVKEVLADVQYDTKSLYNVEKNGNDEIINITFDTWKLNELLYSSLNTIDESLLAAQDGKADPTTKDVFYEDGVLYQVPLGYLTHLFFLYDKGPNINVHMKMLNDVTGEIKTSIEEYGINSVMVNISLVVRVNAQVITVLSTNEIQNECEIPLVLQIVNGKVPSYSPYMSSGNT